MKASSIFVPAAMMAGALATTTAFAANARGLEAGTYQIDPSHSYAYFTVGHMGLSEMQGRIDVTDGTITIAEPRSDSQVQVSLDPASVNTGHEARDEHLRNMDGFFNVSEYPEMRFESTSVTFDDEDEATIQGNLTLHGTTRPVTLEVEDMACRVNPLEESNYTCGFSAETTVQRSDFGMDAYSDLVGNEIDIAIEIEANKPVDSQS